MYQFTTSTVINSALDSNKVTPKYSGDATKFVVTRVNTFKKDNILGVYKRAYEAGVKEVAKVTIGTATAGKVIRLSIEVRLAQQNAEADYANSYLWFRKPIVVEAISTGVAATDATALRKLLNKIKDRLGYSHIVATNSGAEITLTAKDHNQRFYSVKCEQESVSPNSIIEMEYAPVAGTTFVITTKGKQGFGDDLHMVKSVMVQTFENTKYLGSNSEGRPILGGNYSQFTIRYRVEKHVDEGITESGHSITTHVFWVKSDLADAFEAELSKTYPAIESLETIGALVLTADDLLDLSEADTTTVKVAGATGAVSFVSGTPATATIGASTGVVTAVAAGSTVITATDSLGKTGTITITVVE